METDTEGGGEKSEKETLFIFGHALQNLSSYLGIGFVSVLGSIES